MKKNTNIKTEKKASPQKIKVFFALSEADPFIKTGGLGDVGGSLPAALSKCGADVSVILPKYSSIADEYSASMQYLGNITVPLSWRNIYCGVFKLIHNKVTYFFLDNEHYFAREMPYGYDDDAERMAFFSKAVLECIPLMGKGFPNILHCHDWHTALVPVFLREDYTNLEGYRDIKTVFSVHNLKFQGVFPPQLLGDLLGLDRITCAHQLIRNGALNYMQGALLYSDYLTTVSPSYAEEIKTSYFGENIENIFNEKSGRLKGILNGIDSVVYSPSKDDFISENYGISTISKKAVNKAALQSELGLSVDKDIPLIVMVSRLTEQKGLDLIIHTLDELLSTNEVQFAFLGTGDKKYEHDLSYFAEKYAEKLALCLKFDTPLSHRFYAGGDMLIMPSKFEPCGLSQMIAMAYGTVPIVRETGGLRDSVTAYNKFTGEGNGFSFANYNAHELLFTIKDAISLYKDDPKAWLNICLSAMRADFKWKSSAEKYHELYKSLLG